MSKRLIVAVDHQLMLEAFVRLLSDDFEVVAAVTSGQALLREAGRLRPEAIVLDLATEMNVVETTRRLRSEVPYAKVVVVTQHLSRTDAHAAFAAGATAYVAKQSTASELFYALRLAIDGRYYVTPLVGLKATHAGTSPELLFAERLTSRQREVLQLIAEGKTTKEIAAVLRISVKTAEFHRARLMDELGLRTIAELTRYALTLASLSS